MEERKLSLSNSRTQKIMSLLEKTPKSSNIPAQDQIEVDYTQNNDGLLLLDIPEVTNQISEPVANQYESTNDIILGSGNANSQPISPILSGITNEENYKDIYSVANLENALLFAVGKIDNHATNMVDRTMKLDEEFSVAEDRDIDSLIMVMENEDVIPGLAGVNQMDATDADFELIDKGHQEENSSPLIGNETNKDEKPTADNNLQTLQEHGNKIDDPDFIPGLNIADTSRSDENSSNAVERKRKKRQFVSTKDWNDNKRKERREMGKEYAGRKLIDGKWKYNIKREAKKIKEPCNYKALLKGKLLKCRMFSEQQRETIFRRFWSEMGWNERKVYVSFLVDSKATQRSRNRTAEGASRRDETLVYYLKINEERQRVCKQMFLNTHCVKENMILDWLKKSKIKENVENHEPHTNNKEEIKMNRYKNMKKNLRGFF
ncbi:uncharacterized protein LOC126748687 [Anthonomus grandis grandis]|uniref:uncharacterized protein LOC126748687 n=1 Tax=Anthonomus grandis grandis TaxID=2921223 RepID=UPI002164F1FA|nr:uncharacterized protein LOC126748687 [Anthonomus grandis grandis]